MKKNNNLPKIALSLLFICIFGLLIFNKQTNNQKGTETNETQNQETTITVKDVSLSSPSDASDYVGKTVLEATKALVKETKVEGMGINAYVTSLNGRTADSKNNEFWELLINGKQSEVGAGSYIIKSGDKIIWQIKTF